MSWELQCRGRNGQNHRAQEQQSATFQFRPAARVASSAFFGGLSNRVPNPCHGTSPTYIIAALFPSNARLCAMSRILSYHLLPFSQSCYGYLNLSLPDFRLEPQRGGVLGDGAFDLVRGSGGELGVDFERDVQGCVGVAGEEGDDLFCDLDQVHLGGGWFDLNRSVEGPGLGCSGSAGACGTRATSGRRHHGGQSASIKSLAFVRSLTILVECSEPSGWRPGGSGSSFNFKSSCYSAAVAQLRRCLNPTTFDCCGELSRK